MEKEILYNFFDGKSSKEEKEAIRIWIEASPENKKELFREREFFDAMVLSGKNHSVIQKRQTIPFFNIIKSDFIKIVAVFAITFACTMSFYKSEIRRISQEINTITVPVGQRVNLTLPDGTNVWLNASSVISYPAAFTSNKRIITLDGEAYFDVTYNNNRPFIVQTSKYDIEVLGTKFNLEAYSNSKDFCTSLIEGKVRILNKENPSKTVLLSPNNMASLIDGDLSISPISDFDIFRWKEGLICFRNMDFNQLMSRFEKCYGIQIIVENNNLINYVCSGKFRIADGVDNALRILQKDAKYTFERNKEDSVIYIK